MGKRFEEYNRNTLYCEIVLAFLLVCVILLVSDERVYFGIQQVHMYLVVREVLIYLYIDSIVFDRH